MAGHLVINFSTRHCRVDHFRFPRAVRGLIVGAGGFLGLGTHGVAGPVSKFKLVDKKLVLAGATKESLKASPPFQYAN